MEINAINFLKLSSILSSRVEGFDSVFLNKKFNLTIKDKFLIFLKNGAKSPASLIEFLGVAKTNLALISIDLINGGFIQKQKDSQDKRLINYSLTEKGSLKADQVVQSIQENLQNSLEYKNKNEEINLLVEKLIKLLE